MVEADRNEWIDATEDMVHKWRTGTLGHSELATINPLTYILVDSVKRINMIS